MKRFCFSRNPHMNRHLILVPLVLVTFVCSVHGANISFTQAIPMSSVAGATQGGYAFDEQYATPQLPLSETDIASAGNCSSQTIYSFSETDNVATLSWDFNHSRGAVTQNGLWTFAGTRQDARFRFSVATASNYSISGNYAMNNTGDGEFLAYVSLRDATDNIGLFQSHHKSFYTEDESITLGQPDAEENTISGSATGTLDPTHEYDFEYDYYISNWISTYWFPVTAATAVGSMELTIVPIPEPSTLALTALGLLGLLRWGWLRRR